MSKEAKIGLLLGLLLIVGIALVLRGLHRQDEPMVEQELAITGQDERSDSPDPGSDIDIPQAVDGLSDGSYAAGASDRTTNPAGYYESADRYSQDIPGPEYDPQDTTPVIPPSGDPLAGALDRITEPVYGVGPLGPQRIDPGFTTAGGGLDLPGLDLPGRADAARTAERFYVVEDNDNLTKIALRVYGSREGRKYSNIKRIFEANRSMLKNMDDIYIGQKLLIPRLTGSPTAGNAGSSAGGSTGTPAGPAAATGKMYVVRDKDTLWDIAEAQLGSGIRYKEIVTLNQIKDERMIHAGMTLRMP